MGGGPAGTGLWLGLDTGGTYTDAVLLADQRRVIASAKALTTHWDLAIGIGDAFRAVLAALPPGRGRADVELVSVSTTLATNAVVEHRFSSTCTVLVGFDQAMIERSGLEREPRGSIVSLAGGHDAHGEELEPLDEARLLEALRASADRVSAYAVAARFSVRNPAHELRARQLIRAHTARPVTCAHELSSRLDAPRRALTAALNARLTPPIRQLLEALAAVLKSAGVQAPLMIVKGDGSLMSADVALECPVETILSGPAASIVGAGFLTGLSDFAVADMGGTTTDCALVCGGRPGTRDEGALVGGWRTMVEAVDVRTVGLGGDSEVRLDRDHRLTIGPRRAMPLSRLAHQQPAALDLLRKIAALDRPPEHATCFAFRNPGRERAAGANDAPGANGVAGANDAERRLWAALTPAAQPLSQLVRNASAESVLRRLADAGHVTIAAFTPSDALHVLGTQQGWSVEAAQLGARLLAIEERNGRGQRGPVAAGELCARVVELVIRESARAVLGTALARDPGLEPRSGSWGRLGDRLIADVVSGQPFSALAPAGIRLRGPLVAIGAPAAAYYPEVARRLGTTLHIPEHAAVCNAVGAVAGVVSETVEILVNQPELGLFRVHDPAGSSDFSDAAPAIEHATARSQVLALAAAQRAGARDPHVETVVNERRAELAPGTAYLAEATVRSVASGRPRASGSVADGTVADGSVAVA